MSKRSDALVRFDHIGSEGSEGDKRFGKHYRNPRCLLVKQGIKPYRRCDTCSLVTRRCLGIQNTFIATTIALLLLFFLFLDNSLMIRGNIVLIVSLLVILGYKINDNLDNLAKSDYQNTRLNTELRRQAANLEEESTSRRLKLEQMLIQDELTGLINRPEFEKRLSIYLDEVRSGSANHVLCFLDLDRFKIINDLCGHLAGDELLRQITPLLEVHVRDSDTIARFGGDEFAMLFRQCGIDHAISVTERIRQSIENYRFSWRGTQFTVGASIGVIGINQDSGSVVDVLAAVNDACYRAKDLGRNRVHVYEHDSDHINRLHTETLAVTRIVEALDNNRFVLHFQPIISVNASDEVHRHYEVLVHMLDADGNTLPPSDFLPAAERFNLMPKIDRWVINQAFCDFIKLQEVGPVRLSINLSGNSFTEESLLGFIKEQLIKYHIPAKNINFEITETSAIMNLAKATAFMQDLRALGCRFSLDDFGSGLSSFTYLKNLPVDALKIDGSFVKNIVSDESDRNMVEIMNQIGHMLDLVTIAEFVENNEILSILRDIGVDYAQGYGLGHPQPLDKVMIATRKNASKHRA